MNKPDFEKLGAHEAEYRRLFGSAPNIKSSLWLDGYKKGCEKIWNDYVVPSSGKSLEEWIKVEDRLPEFETPVLCYYFPRQPIMEGRTIGILRRVDRSLISNSLARNLDWNGFTLAADVTHWQPLPSAPIEKT